MVSKKTTMAVCGAVMVAASILASVPAYAETRKDVIAVTPGKLLFYFQNRKSSQILYPCGFASILYIS